MVVDLLKRTTNQASMLSCHEQTLVKRQVKHYEIRTNSSGLYKLSKPTSYMYLTGSHHTPSNLWSHHTPSNIWNPTSSITYTYLEWHSIDSSKRDMIRKNLKRVGDRLWYTTEVPKRPTRRVSQKDSHALTNETYRCSIRVVIRNNSSEVDWNNNSVSHAIDKTRLNDWVC